MGHLGDGIDLMHFDLPPKPPAIIRRVQSLLSVAPGIIRGVEPGLMLGMSAMMMQQMLLGKGGGSLAEALYPRTSGTAIGDCTNYGGLSAAFDGTTSKSYSACAGKNGTTAYLGKTMGAAAPLSKIVVYGSNDYGLSSGGTAESITWSLYGKNGTPSNGTDGAQLATGSITDADNSTARTFTSGDTTTAYTNVWLYWTAGANLFAAQMEIYVMQ
jgi:hypothetical protein